MTVLRHPERIWTKHSSGEETHIELMDKEWIKNSINMIRRGHDIKGRRIGEAQTSKLEWLLEELAHKDETEGWDA